MNNKPSLAGYVVEFIPFERRLAPRRTPVENAVSELKGERRRTFGRRGDDLVESKATKPANLSH
ncbi:hypothetical protein [Sulfurirhabdus autotrophica]|uniref:Uncharacterized protein n=1 Tax=Sulfurirhabdus autotrophica TaxID=1706046 RepID=A0A4R3YFJ5_9PROT|nr:hypothetical protein [Sulfurirhabdus autotrophica]TCV90702.1 hypothetical protein EDC63_101676 [Sulfurirhabdus autotrophica]